MDDFEKLLSRERPAVERYVRYRIPERADAEDILQETYLAAFRAFPELRDEAAFKSWLLRIARSKCNDWFRAKARQPVEKGQRPFPTKENVREIPREFCEIHAEFPCCRPSRAPLGHTWATKGIFSDVHATGKNIELSFLTICRAKARLTELPQAEIARRLGIPPGTVKSRLYS